MAKRKRTDIVQFKVRLRENLRRRLETAAKGQERSLNSEIVARLEQSFEQASLTNIHDRIGGLLGRFEENVLKQYEKGGARWLPPLFEAPETTNERGDATRPRRGLQARPIPRDDLAPQQADEEPELFQPPHQSKGGQP